ncbi:MAG: PEP-CTERM sorting domain-containing protein [Verrucomicrobia bacterium]|jgi:hypothetical protein|nr:PEP-CTERM sorting domain-containing protein [Verrucomicrobiota bacterium]
MKTKYILLAGLITAGSLQASLISVNFTGEFTSGSLLGTSITGFIDIEDNGLFSGTADTDPLTNPDGDLVDLGFEFEPTPGDLIFFDLFDDLDPLANFSDGEFTGLDYFGTNLDGDILNVFYDAFAPDAATGILVNYESFSGDVSTGTLDLPTNVPEPGTYGLLLGLAVGTGVLLRRRRV